MKRRLAPFGVAALLLAGMLVPVSAHTALAASIITVKSTGDSASCTAATETLRCALMQANTDGSSDTVKFNVPKTDPGCQGTPLVCMIQPATPLPELTANNTTIDGYTQLGASPNTLPLAPFPNPEYPIPLGTTPGFYGDNARLVIQLDGTNQSSGNGLEIDGNGNTIRGLDITNSPLDGIFVDGGNGNKIQGNFIGPLPNGREAGDRNSGYSNDDGVLIDSGTGASNLVGGPFAANSNLISGNEFKGVYVYNTSAWIQRNFIGTDRTGTVNVQNGQSGVYIEDAHDVTVGGSTYLTRNILSGNGSSGIYETNSDRTTVTGNFAGTDVSGTVALGNSGDGVELNAGRHTTIGGLMTALINVISGNKSEGINASTEDDLKVEYNFVGADVTGKRTLENDDPGFQSFNLNTTDVNHAHPAMIIGNTITAPDDDAVRTDTDYGDIFKGNRIGVDNNGLNPLPTLQDGMEIQSSSYTQIGGTTAPDGNVISNALFGAGVELDDSDHTTIQGNKIGTDISGAKKMGNGAICPFCNEGIEINGGSSETLIGGTAPGASNLIDNSGDNGIDVTESSDTTIQGNWVGVGNHSRPMGNGGNGILLNNATGTNLVGGTTIGTANWIAYNALAGVVVTGPPSNAAIRANKITWNGDIGIDLAPTDEVNCSASDGGLPFGTLNDQHQCPIITAATPSSVSGTDTINGDVVDVFIATNEADDTGGSVTTLHGEGMTYLGSATVSGGTWSLPIAPNRLGHGAWVTATSTDAANTVTSEFALNFKVS
jgi:hypothetical protein